ncbi:MAG: murein biosynthesis integral membrane protein MurJ [Deltaproteobacteria bacterium]|nr:murein biosynthesis integral membrane protein MurJ [Deltaproteobacteria bacterium]
MSEGEILKRAGHVGFFTLISRITGLLRDMAIAYAFGARAVADAFFVAFRIPNLLRRLFAEGALTISFVPVFTETYRRDPEEAKKLANVSWSLLAVVLAGISFLGILLSPWIVRLIAWGFTSDPEKFRLTVFLTRIIFPYIFLVSLAAWAMGVLNSLKHFAAPASSSIFMNLGIIVGALGLSYFTNPPVLGLALGVLLGGIWQLWIHFPFLKKFGFFPKVQWDPSHPGVKKILGMMLPAAFGAAVYQFNVIVITQLASFLPAGAVSYLWYADRIMEFPLGIWGIAMATVLLPSLSDHAAERDYEKLKETLRYGLRMVLFLSIPAAGGLMVLAEPIVRLLFEHGTFSADSTVQTAHALIFFAIGLPFISGVRITSNAFYSVQDSKSPVKTAAVSMGFNLLLALLFMGRMGHNGLALAISLSSFVNLLLQLWVFRRKMGHLGLKAIGWGVLKTALSTLVMMVFLKFLQGTFFYDVVGGWREAVWLVLLISAGLLSFLGMEFILRGREAQEFFLVLQKRGGKR